MFESRCGIVCNKCDYKEQMNCGGCIAIDKPFWGDSCPVKSCCEEQNLEHCGQCSKFPCDLLNQFAYDQEQGDDGKRIETLKKWSAYEKDLAVIKRAGDLINSKTDYIGDGMEGYVVLSLINENGYPTSSTMTISKADGINRLTFLSDSDGAKAQRVARCNKACVCLASSEYHISLTGTAEIITDVEVKKANWQEVVTNYYGVDHTEPSWAVLRFTAETYNIFFADDDSEAKGNL